jgi:hypothetical protein
MGKFWKSMSLASARVKTTAQKILTSLEEHAEEAMASPVKEGPYLKERNRSKKCKVSARQHGG